MSWSHYISMHYTKRERERKREIVTGGNESVTWILTVCSLLIYTSGRRDRQISYLLLMLSHSLCLCNFSVCLLPSLWPSGVFVVAFAVYEPSQHFDLHIMNKTVRILWRIACCKLLEKGDVPTCCFWIQFLVCSDIQLVPKSLVREIWFPI